MKNSLLQSLGFETPNHLSIQNLISRIDFPDGHFDVNTEKCLPDECVLGKTRNNEHYVVVVRCGDCVRVARFVQDSAELVLLSVMKMFGVSLSMHEVKVHNACTDGGTRRRSDCQVQVKISDHDKIFGFRSEGINYMEAALSASFETLRSIYLHLEDRREAEKSAAA